jgi:hypothetical protein
LRPGFGGRLEILTFCHGRNALGGLSSSTLPAPRTAFARVLAGARVAFARR